MENEKNLPGRNEAAGKTEKKTLPAKKLPGMFRKTYTEKAFEKRILRKIYIEEDRELVESIFTERVSADRKGRALKTPKLAVPASGEFAKDEVKRLTLIAKSVKRNRGRFRVVPFVAVVGFVAALVLVVSAFKNKIARKAITYACESAFGAKTDVGYVDVRLLGIGVTVGNLAVGDKNSAADDYKRNLFELERLTVAFNLAQALRGKFIAENLDVAGIQFGTARATSCYLPSAEKKEEKAAEESAFMKELRAKSESALAALRQQANDMLGGSDVNEIVQSIQAQLKTPQAAEEATARANALVEKWRSKPEERKAQIERFQAEAKKYRELDFSQFQNHPEKIAATVAEITKTMASVSELQKTAQATAGDIQADAQEIQNVAAVLSDAVKADTELAAARLGAVTNAVTNAKSILTNALDTVGYQILGKYYPYVKKGIDYAAQMKANAQSNSAASGSGAKKPAAKAKGATGRLSGTTIPFSRTYPTFWLKSVSASGYTDKAGGHGFSGSISNVTSDQDLANSPTTARAEFGMGGVNHAGTVVLDARSASTAPLISMDYAGTGFRADVDGRSIAAESGVPSVLGTANVTLSGTAGPNGFSAGGNVALEPLSLTSDGFPNAMVTRYYTSALSAVKSMSLGYAVAYSEGGRLTMDLSGDFADVFAEAIKSAVMTFANDAKEAALLALQAQIDGLNAESLGRLGAFTSLLQTIDVQNLDLQNVQKILQEALASVQASGAASPVTDVLTNIVSGSAFPSGQKGSSAASPDSSGAASDSADSAAGKNDKAKEAISDGLKSLFGR